MSDTFTCPRCTDTYQPHWRDPDGTKLCRNCADGTFSIGGLGPDKEGPK